MYREIKDKLVKLIDNEDKVLVVTGARQVGKTTLLKSVLGDNAVYFDIDDKTYKDFFDSLSLVKYSSYLTPIKSSGKNIIVIDEAQRLKDPGLCAKIIHDNRLIKVILTGSSSLDITQRTTESLAGRKINITVYPLTLYEYIKQEEYIVPFALNEINLKIIEEILNEKIRIGTYPAISRNFPEVYLKDLAESIILKDILYLGLIRKSENLIDLLKYFANTIGVAQGILPISKGVQLSRKTVEYYINILESSYIIYAINGFKDLRNDEVSKISKYYFFDTGLRNYLINDFRQLSNRQDKSSLFENFIITEILKRNEYNFSRYETFFWKTTQGANIDIVLRRDNKILLYNFDKKQSSIDAFISTYKDKYEISVIDNILEFILREEYL